MPTQRRRAQREETLLAGRQRVGFKASKLLERNHPLSKRLVGEIAVEGLIGNRLNLGEEERKRFADSDAEAVEAGLAGKRRIVRSVLGDAKSGILA